MVELGHLENVNQPSSTAAPWVGAAEDDTAESCVDNGSGAHGAGFFGHIKVAIVEAPVLHCRLGLSDGEHFGMRCGVLEHFDLVPRAGNDFPFPHNDRAARHLVCGVGTAGLTQRFPHEVFVAGKFHSCKVSHLHGFAQNHRCSVPFSL